MCIYSLRFPRLYTTPLWRIIYFQTHHTLNLCNFKREVYPVCHTVWFYQECHSIIFCCMEKLMYRSTKGLDEYKFYLMNNDKLYINTQSEITYFFNWSWVLYSAMLCIFQIVYICSILLVSPAKFLHCLENSSWKRLWTSYKTDCVIWVLGLKPWVLTENYVAFLISCSYLIGEFNKYSVAELLPFIAQDISTI